MTGAGNWTYLLPGARPVLVDAGVGRPEHLDAIAAEAPGGPDRVLVTHAHPDHASGAPALVRRFPAARFLKRPWPGHDGTEVRWAALADGDAVETDQGPLIAVHTPGHSPDHLVFWHRDSGTAFTGDLLVAGGTVVIPATRGGRLSDYLRSLETVASLGLRRALPAHGPPIDDPASLIGSYFTHRQFRERQVVDALRAGVGDPAAIAARIYDGLDPALQPMAEESVLAHLVKLADEGRAAADGGAWRLVG
ncbi:MAG: MBL fold metallo-hydrolase [Vicinamibacterales bacterium]